MYILLKELDAKQPCRTINLKQLNRRDTSIASVKHM